MRHYLFTLLLFIALFSPDHGFAEEMVSVRLVNYVGNSSELELYLTGEYISLDPTVSFKEGVKYRLSAKNGKLFLTGGKITQEIEGPIVLIPEKHDEHHLIRINRRPYMGAMELRLEKGQYIRPVNQLPLEDYLKGVVPFEVFPSWDMEALKAQALAARTYAVSHLQDDMDDTIRFQAYGGYSWHPRTTIAVEDTKGQVITYQNRLIDAFYSASNGGMTESNAHVWGGRPISYFPIQSDPYDPIQPWEFTLSRTQINLEEIDWDHPRWWEELKEKDEDIADSIKRWLSRNGHPGDIKILSVPQFTLSSERNASKRALKGSIEIEFMERLLDGTVFFDKVLLHDVPLSRIRPMIGGNRFKSYLIETLESDGEAYRMKGKGYGHGVGMSQWGASVMGQKGKTYKDILQFYFPGTKITSVLNTK